MRKLVIVGAATMLLLAMAAPASATKPTNPDLEEGHKIWICHATRSLSNPYVKILIDIAAWDVADPDSNDHGPDHHAREKDGVMWADYALENPDDECVLDPPPPGPTCTWTDKEVDYVVTFGTAGSHTKLYYGSIVYATVSGLSIPAGTYAVDLVSADWDRGSPDGTNPYIQPNERWRLQGTSPSGYTNDLPDGIVDISGQVTSSSVTFGSSMTSLTAEHWSVANADTNPNSVVPQAVCLTLLDD